MRRSPWTGHPPWWGWWWCWPTPAGRWCPPWRDRWGRSVPPVSDRSSSRWPDCRTRRGRFSRWRAADPCRSDPCHDRNRARSDPCHRCRARSGRRSWRPGHRSRSVRNRQKRRTVAARVRAGPWADRWPAGESGAACPPAAGRGRWPSAGCRRVPFAATGWWRPLRHGRWRWLSARPPVAGLRGWSWWSAVGFVGPSSGWAGSGSPGRWSWRSRPLPEYDSG